MKAEALQRHALVRVDTAAFAEEVARLELADEPPIAGWAHRGWPLVVRRRGPGDRPGRLALGLPLPPALGKRRIALDIPPAAIVAADPPLALHRVRDAAPAIWQPAIEALLALAERCEVEARVFGSVAWAALTGLDYLTAGSDLDLIWPATPRLDELLVGLVAIERVAPGRIDGEIVEPSGAAANWRELASGAAEVLGKSLGGVAIVPADRFRHADPVAA